MLQLYCDLTSLNYDLTSLNYDLTSLDYDLTSLDYDLLTLNYDLTSLDCDLTTLNYNIHDDLCALSILFGDGHWRTETTRSPRRASSKLCWGPGHQISRSERKVKVEEVKEWTTGLNPGGLYVKNKTKSLPSTKGGSVGLGYSASEKVRQSVVSGWDPEPLWRWARNWLETHNQ